MGWRLMDKPFREAFALFTSRFEHILLLGVTIILPLLLGHALLSNYIYAVTPTVLGTTIISDIYYTFLTVLLMLFAQVPLIRYMFNEYQGHEGSLKNAYFVFFANGFQFFVFAILASFLTTVGIILFLLPGLIILTLLYPIPFVAAMDNKSIWKSWKSGIRLGKKHFFKLFLLILGMSLIELMISGGITLLILSLTTSFAAQILSHILLNLVFFPIITLIITGFIIKWREEIYTLEANRSAKEEWA